MSDWSFAGVWHALAGVVPEREALVCGDDRRSWLEFDDRADRWDLSGLRAITSSGVTWSPAVKRGLLRHLPHVTLLDSLGASEGLMTRASARASDAEIAPARFAVNERVRVLREDGVDGRRDSIPGDHATVEADGSIRLLGRGSATVNTGGEKVNPEEIEIVLQRNGAVYDCVVLGIPDARFGERVIALVQVADGYYTDEEELRAICRRDLAGYKIPKRFLFVDSLNRAANGKADHQLLKETGADLLDVEAASGGAPS